jgi:hypothetical protein
VIGKCFYNFSFQYCTYLFDRICGLLVRIPGYRSRGPEFDSRRCQIFWEVVGLERGSLSLVRITEALLGRNSSGSGLENRIECRRNPLRWPRNTFYPNKSELNSLAAAVDRSVYFACVLMVTEFVALFISLVYLLLQILISKTRLSIRCNEWRFNYMGETGNDFKYTVWGLAAFGISTTNHSSLHHFCRKQNSEEIVPFHNGSLASLSNFKWYNIVLV